MKTDSQLKSSKNQTLNFKFTVTVLSEYSVAQNNQTARVFVGKISVCPAVASTGQTMFAFHKKNYFIRLKQAMLLACKALRNLSLK